MQKVLIPIVLLAALALAWLYWQQTRPQPLVVSGFVEADQIRVGSRIGGRVARVMVAEGQRVKAGEPLFALEPFDLQERLAHARAQAEAARAEHAKLAAGFRPQELEQAVARRDRLAAALAKAEAGPRKREIGIAEQRVKVAQANFDLATSEHRRVMELAGSNNASQQEIDRVTRELARTQGELAVAEGELALLQEGTRSEEIAEAKAALAEAEAALQLMQAGYRQQDIAQAAARVAAAEADAAAIEAQIAELVVRAPSDSVVEAIDLRPGDLAPANAPAVSLLAADSLWIRSYVPESRLSLVKLNAPLKVRIDSFPDRLFTGRVTFIATEAEFTPRNVQTPEERSKQVFRIKVTLDEGHESLRVGMMGDVLLE